MVRWPVETRSLWAHQPVMVSRSFAHGEPVEPGRGKKRLVGAHVCAPYSLLGSWPRLRPAPELRWVASGPLSPGHSTFTTPTSPSAGSERRERYEIPGQHKPIVLGFRPRTATGPALRRNDGGGGDLPVGSSWSLPGVLADPGGLGQGLSIVTMSGAKGLAGC